MLAEPYLNVYEGSTKRIGRAKAQLHIPLQLDRLFQSMLSDPFL